MADIVALYYSSGDNNSNNIFKDTLLARDMGLYRQTEAVRLCRSFDCASLFFFVFFSRSLHQRYIAHILLFSVVVCVIIYRGLWNYLTPNIKKWLGQEHADFES